VGWFDSNICLVKIIVKIVVKQNTCWKYLVKIMVEFEVCNKNTKKTCN